MTLRTILPFLVFVAVGSCTPAGEPTPSTKSDPPDASGPPAASAGVTSAQATLDSLDDRTPVPLLPMMANHQRVNMRDHLAAVQEIVAGAAANDFVAIEKAATRIGYSEQMGAMCTHMGAGAPGFTQLALEFHRTADTIGAAAKQKDATEVLAALGRTLAKCTGCHTRFKQRIVDDATFRSLTQMAPPSGHGPAHGE